MATAANSFADALYQGFLTIMRYTDPRTHSLSVELPVELFTIVQ